MIDFNADLTMTIAVRNFVPFLTPVVYISRVVSMAKNKSGDESPRSLKARTRKRKPSSQEDKDKHRNQTNEARLRRERWRFVGPVFEGHFVEELMPAFNSLANLFNEALPSLPESPVTERLFKGLGVLRKVLEKLDDKTIAALAIYCAWIKSGTHGLSAELIMGDDDFALVQAYEQSKLERKDDLKTSDEPNK